MNSDQYRNRRNHWQNGDVSPYDVFDSQSSRNVNNSNYYDSSDDEFDFETIADEMENEDYEMNNGSCSNDEYGCVICEKKTVIEETDPQKTTTTWIKITRCRSCPSDLNSNI